VQEDFEAENGKGVGRGPEQKEMAWVGGWMEE